jgi:hypothetical protein
VIGEAEHDVALTTDPLVVSLGICLESVEARVLATVDLNHQLSFGTEEIDDVRTERRLPTKAEAGQPSITKGLPQLELRRRQTLSHDFPQAPV